MKLRWGTNMKITKKQLKQIIKEELMKEVADPFEAVMQQASKILGYSPQLEEESDGSLVVILEEPPNDNVFGAFQSAFPDGEWLDDLEFATGVMG